MTKEIKSDNSIIRYYIDEEKGIVIAAVDKVDIALEVFRILLKQGISINNEQYLNKLSKIEDYTYKTKAVCSERDTFDEKVGMEIARNRLLEKYYKARLEILRVFGDELSRQIDYVEDQMNYSWTSYNRYSEQNQKVLDSQKRD